ncbi:mCG1031965 [Mus musculus]|nr:mCG1031965 [Mus musculus]
MVVCRCRQACERVSVCESTRVHVCVPSSLHHSPGTPPKLPTPPVFSKPTARQSPPPPPAACASPLSISVCLTRETATSGDPVPGPLTPARCAVILAWGVLSGPFHNILFSPGASGKGSE